MAMIIKNGLVRLNETAEHKILDYHLEHGFGIVSGFRHEESLTENRKRNRKLAGILKGCGFGYIKVTGGYFEDVNDKDPRWDDAKPTSDPKIRKIHCIEESFLIPMYNVKTHELITNLDDFKTRMISLGLTFDQDSVLVAPPGGNGKAYYISTGHDDTFGTKTLNFSKMTLASVTAEYFTMKEKTLNKAFAKRKEGVGGLQFESVWVDEPLYTISGVRVRDANGELPPFGSHLYNNSTIKDVTTEDQRRERLERKREFERRVARLERIIKHGNY